MYCSRCGSQVNEGSKFCAKCGNSIEVQNNSHYISNNNVQIDSSGPLNNTIKKEKNYGLRSLIYGILSIVFSGIIGIPLGIVSIIASKKDYQKTSNSKIGKVLGIIGVILSVLTIIGGSWLIDMIGSYYNDNYDYSDNNNNNNNDNIYDEPANSLDFKPGITEDYSSLGYIEYIMPECWKYDDKMSAEQQYNSYVFKYKDNKSMAEVKAFTSLEDVTIEDVKNDIIGTGWTIDKETIENINGINWHKIVTGNFSLSDNPNNYYHSVFYVAISKQKKNFYMFHFYVSNNLILKEKEYFDDSVKYILENAEILKYNE